MNSRVTKPPKQTDKHRETPKPNQTKIIMEWIRSHKCQESQGRFSIRARVLMYYPLKSWATWHWVTDIYSVPVLEDRSRQICFVSRLYRKRFPTLPLSASCSYWLSLSHSPISSCCLPFCASVPNSIFKVRVLL